jgi:signal transduction histidine kinase
VNVTARNLVDRVEITVSDTGVGISEENIEKLFKIDTQVSTNGTNNEPGTGLGLVLCKEFVELNKGELKVESKIGEGTKFILTVPRAKTERETAALI